MTDEQKLQALEICRIEDVYKYSHDAGWALSVLPLTQQRVMHLEHALLRLLSEIERKHKIGNPVHPNSKEAETAWALLKEPRLT
jgi:hypothetical protein